MAQTTAIQYQEQNITHQGRKCNYALSSTKLVKAVIDPCQGFSGY